MEESYSRSDGGRRLAKALAWFSIGLGIAELTAPKRLARLMGIRGGSGTRNVLRIMGAREIGHGVLILLRPSSAASVWSRVGGDVLDLSLLGKAMTTSRKGRGRIAGAMAAVLGVTVLDVYDGLQLTGNGTAGRHGDDGAQSLIRRITDRGPIEVSKTLTVRRPVDEVYSFWRDFRNFPRFMNHLESVDVLDDRRSHWTAQGPAGRTVEWDAEIVDDVPNERISWRSLPDADIDNSGSVRFKPAPGDRGTEIRVNLRYDAPAGKLGAAVAMLFGEEPRQQVQDDLLAFKQVMETGEVVRSEGTMKGRFFQHPAQRPAERSPAEG